MVAEVARKLDSCLHEPREDKYSASRVLAVAATVEFLALAPVVLVLLMIGPLTIPMLETWGPWSLKFFAGALFPLVVNYAKRAFNE